MAKKKPERTARRALELFKDARFSKRVVKNKKAYDRKRDKRAINEMESLTPVNAMGASDVAQRNIQTYDPLLGTPAKRKLKKFSMFKRAP